jgi:hypothetical protein
MTPTEPGALTRHFWRVVLPTRRRSLRLDAGDVALPRREPRPPMITVAGVVQATGVLSFDFEPPPGRHV